jgi:hypothetical protein
MILIGRAARILWFVALSSVAHAQSAPPNTASKTSAPTLMQQMVGTWKVQQRMWLGFGADAIHLPPATARRSLMAGGFLQEIMEPAKKSGKESFIRTAYFNFNAVSQQYEYFSLDSRAPQMMNERSDKAEEPSKSGRAEIKLNGGSFVAPQWGEAKNVAFTYRLTISAIKNNRQAVQLYGSSPTCVGSEALTEALSGRDQDRQDGSRLLYESVHGSGNRGRCT